MKILVVDDHPLIREALRHVLLGLDPKLSLLEAEDCPSAQALAQANPDLALVLLDLSLPGASGFSALELFREQFESVPVVVLSASDERDVVIRALDAGAMGFIPKTSSNEVMLNALRLVLSGGVYVPPQALGQADSVEHATRATPPAPVTPTQIGLTERQAEVLALMLQGKPNKLICRELDLAEGTVKIHVTAILKALNVANRTQAVIAASRIGLRLPPPRAAAPRH
jgi:DNA-binding NarL/FixJ family response regulator